MKLPKKIEPDRIKDSIVEVRYTSKIPHEVALGFIYKSLDDTYKYTNRPLGKQELSLPINLGVPKEFKLSIGGTSIFYNDYIKFEIQPGSIIFNCLDKYIKWENFEPEIEKVLLQLSSSEVIDSYSRIGLRYICEYPEMELADISKFSFSFGLPLIKSDIYSFRSEFFIDEYRVILNLNNRLPHVNPLLTNNQRTSPKISIIDIDVIKDNLSISNLNELLEIINSVHLKEKEVFFNVLDENFLLSLNPEY